MRFKKLLTPVALGLLVCATAAAQTQDQKKDQKVIDDFVTTRGVSFDDSGAKGSTQKPSSHSNGTRRNNNGGSVAKSSGSNRSQGAGKGTTASTKKGSTSTGSGSGITAQTNTETAGADGAGSNASGVQSVKVSETTAGGPLRPIGLGYTVFMKDSAGGLLAADPTQEYRQGDRIVIALEPNTEGYIYIFDAENDGNPSMLFPNAQLDKGANVAHEHVRETYPADVNYAYEFDNHPSVEHLYVIVSRRPLEDVPTGDALAEACRKCDEYGWKPTAAQWQRIKAGVVDKRVVEVKNTQLAQLQKQPLPASSLQRGIKIKKDDPAPAVVRVNDSSAADTLVTVIKLVHK
jgi:Domain of unknown function (DUF4384)